MTLVARLVLLVLAASLPGLATQVWLEYRLRDSRLMETHAEALRQARLVAAEKDEVIDSGRSLLLTLASMPLIRGGGTGCNGVFRELEPRFERFLSIGILSADGRLLCTSEREGMPDYLEVIRDQARLATEPLRMVVGEFAVGANGRAVLPMLMRFPLEAGGQSALLYAVLDLDWLGDGLAATRPPDNVAIVMTDRNGTVFARFPDHQEWLGSKAPAVLAGLANGAKEGTVELDGVDGVRRIYGYVPMQLRPHGVFVAVGVGVEAALGAIDNASRDAMVIIALGFAAAALLALFGGQVFILRPLRRLQYAMVRWKQGDRTHIAERAGVPEFEELRRAYNDLANVLHLREKDLVNAREEALQASTAKSRLLASAGHDLRQPLQAIVLTHAALAPGLSDSHRSMLDMASRAARKLGRSLDTLVEAARFESGRVTPCPRLMPVSELLAEVEDQWTLVAAEKGLSLRVVRSMARIHSDHMLLASIVNNLVANAVRYTDKGGIVIGCRRSGDALDICVCDSGMGIPSERLGQIFDEFHQEDRGRREGFGLGLAIVRRAAELLGHRVMVRSVVGRGSCFAVRVPRAAPRPVLLPLPTDRPPAAGTMPESDKCWPTDRPPRPVQIPKRP